MAIWFRRIAKICLGVAPVIAFGAQVGPKDAISNLSAWLNLLGIEQIPHWLSSPQADTYATYVSIIVGLICIIIVSYPYLTRSRKKPVYKKTDQGHSMIAINTTTPVNQASQPWLEWLHVQAAPRPGALPETTIAWANLDSRAHDLRWQSDKGPAEEQTIRAERPGLLPIVIRSQQNCAVMGTSIQAGICYLTDINFQVHHVSAVQINSGTHQLFIMVRTRDNRDAMREFRLIVSPTLGEPLRLEPV